MGLERISHRDLARAAAILKLGESATLEEVKEAYRKLAKRYHPDSASRDGDPEKFMEISFAYKIMTFYASSYKMEFSEEAFFKQFPEEKLRKKFLSDPLWTPHTGKRGKKED